MATPAPDIGPGSAPKRVRPTTITLLGVAAVAAATLAYQVVLTRLFSAVMSYHFSFLAISIALLGTGAGALVVYVQQQRRGTDVVPEHALATWCACFALALALVPVALVRIDLAHESAGFALRLAAACALAAVPPFAAGSAITLAITGYTRWVGTVYAFDLVGAGAGALLVVPALWRVPAPTLIVLLAVPVGVAAMLLPGHAPAARRLGTAGVALAALLTVVSTRLPVLHLPTGYLVSDDTVTVAERWSPLSRVFGFDRPATATAPRFAAVAYDRVYAPVPIV